MSVIGRMDKQVEEVLIEPIARRHEQAAREREKERERRAKQEEDSQRVTEEDKQRTSD